MKRRWSLSKFVPLTAAAWMSALGLAASAGEPKAADTTAYPAGYVNEAPLPEGYPPPAEPGKIVEKSYPLSRTYSATGSTAFFKCFGYLTVKRHEMTAPVLMDYTYAEQGKPANDSRLPRGKDDRLHFVLEKPGLDEPGKAGPVTVADLPMLRVVSSAFQGDLTDDVVRRTEAELRKYVADRPELESAGPLRVLGYNSPMLKAAKRYWEIQLPVRARKAG